MSAIEKINPKNLYYPPGGILIWIILSVEIITFLMVTISFMYSRSADVAVFNEAQTHLNATFGTINTIILITSGFFMARTVTALKDNNHKKANTFITISTFLGFLFLVLKGYEYYHKIDLGLTLRTNTFFTYYWMMTGFHFIHVMLGIVLLLAMKYYIRIKRYTAEDMLDVETVATYWHMCDIIWILIFPVLYLMN